MYKYLSCRSCRQLSSWLHIYIEHGKVKGKIPHPKKNKKGGLDLYICI